jgi:hypothetical protein
MSFHGVAPSTSGQNVLVMESYPPHITSLCPQFKTKWAFCGCGHPITLPYREGIIVCNVNDMTVYFKNYLDRCVHAGMSIELADEYVDYHLQQGYVIKDQNSFDITQQHILIVGSDRSISVKNCFSVINYGTPQFNNDVQQLFNESKLDVVGQTLLTAHNQSIQSQTESTSRGQPSIINFGFAQQNSRDNTSIPGLNVPMLTLASVKDIINVKSGTPLIEHINEMMATATLFFDTHYSELKLCKPFQNERRIDLFGNKIADIINHPNGSHAKHNKFEACSTGYKTEANNGFKSHIDILNSKHDPTFAYVMVMSSVYNVPANPTIAFGNDKKYYPFAIFYNRSGCELACQTDSSIDRWLHDINSYLQSQPSYQKEITQRCLQISSSLEEVHVIIKRRGQLYRHSKAHTDKHVQFSSACCTLLQARETLPWWRAVHVYEYLYFVGLTCTPVSAWFAMEEVFK